MGHSGLNARAAAVGGLLYFMGFVIVAMVASVGLKPFVHFPPKIRVIGLLWPFTTLTIFVPETDREKFMRDSREKVKAALSEKLSE